MNIPLALPKPTGLEPVQRFVLDCVSWEQYEKFLEAVGKRRLRVTYDRGRLEFMTTSHVHEMYKSLFGYILFVLMDELDIPMRALGSTTFRKQALQRGLEPDQCYYLRSAARVRDWRKLDLATAPPPDLALEIEVSRGVVDRLGVYAGLGVPEVWSFDGERMVVRRLREGGYEIRPRSEELPFVPVEDIAGLMAQGMNSQDDRAFARAIREWVRARVVPLHQASGRKRRRKSDR
jgi:Uma2 family endonuclease